MRVLLLELHGRPQPLLRTRSGNVSEGRQVVGASLPFAAAVNPAARPLLVCLGGGNGKGRAGTDRETDLGGGRQTLLPMDSVLQNPQQLSQHCHHYLRGGDH